MNSLKVEDFSLEYTIDSGQFFLYELINDFYYIVLRDKVFKVKQEDNILYYDNISEEELIYFFNLNEDLKQLTIDFTDEYLSLALEKYFGLRILKQDLWQCIIGFLCSQCSNISKIKMNMRLICKTFGEKIVYDNLEFYTFPKIGKIDNLEKLRETKVGYRAEYIYNMNEICKNTNFLIDLKQKDYINSKNMLLEIRGIGEKVADCICLYGLGHKESFPIDTWVKQILEKLYLKKKSTKQELNIFVNDYFKKNKGLKQQYLFHYARYNLKKL